MIARVSHQLTHGIKLLEAREDHRFRLADDFEVHEAPNDFKQNGTREDRLTPLA
ncbi:hypothetical protein [Methyloceanibacter methanicus]|uniref:hypothetical protein n=1 Tax=Methyloceanibacter methanicus TaxID=1774968 RepID=UPI001FCDBEDD|nr:hypothetical protein [Methyloceanibacter methanicus]